MELDEKYISKINKDTAQKLITFLEGIKLGDKALLDIIRSVDSSIELDTNVYSAAKTLSKFLKKDEADTALELLTFLKGIIVKGGATADYMHGLFSTHYLEIMDLVLCTPLYTCQGLNWQYRQLEVPHT